MKKIFSIALALTFLGLTTGCTSSSEDMSAMGYRVGMASYTTSDDSVSSSGTQSGKGAVSTTYITAVFDKDDIIKRVYIDEVETNLAFDSNGQIIQDSNGGIKSKRELGSAYNMKAASPIGKEWYEQIDSLEDYLVGKKASDIIGTVEDSSYDSSQASSGSNDISNTSDATSPMDDSTITSGVNSNDSYTSSNSMDSSNDITSSNSMSGSNNDTDSSYVYDDSYPQWQQEDLKASVTIDTSNIRRAIKRAYENAK